MSHSHISTNIRRAVDELELALDAYVRNKVEEASLRVWNASAEAEYVLFILEIVFDLGIEKEAEVSSKKKKDFDPKSYVIRAQDFLKGALEECQPGENMLKAYEKISTAREFLITLQEKQERPKIQSAGSKAR